MYDCRINMQSMMYQFFPGKNSLTWIHLFFLIIKSLFYERKLSHIINALLVTISYYILMGVNYLHTRILIFSPKKTDNQIEKKEKLQTKLKLINDCTPNHINVCTNKSSGKLSYLIIQDYFWWFLHLSWMYWDNLEDF